MRRTRTSALPVSRARVGVAAGACRRVSVSALTLRRQHPPSHRYRITKDKLLAMPKGKQFDFSEHQIFGKFDLFCRRVIKLLDMFSTIHQFKSLAQHHLEGMDELINAFFAITREFRAKGHDLLDFTNSKVRVPAAALRVGAPLLRGCHAVSTGLRR